MVARDIMTKNVVTVREDVTIEDVIRLLLEYGITGVVVVNENEELEGLVTEKDLLIACDFLGNTNTAIRDFVNRDVIFVDEHADVVEINKILIHKNLKRVPVVAQNRVIGIVSRGDVLKSYLVEN